MKYVLRAVKFFIYESILLSIIIFAVVQLGLVEGGSLDSIFVDGGKSLLQIAVFMAVISAIYPRIRYGSLEISAPGPQEETLAVVKEVMEALEYKETLSSDGVTLWRKKSFAARLLKMTEDTITITKTLQGYTLEGHNKDIFLIEKLLLRKF